MNKWLYIVTLVGTNIAGFLIVALMIAADGGISMEEAAPVMILVLLVATIAHLIFVHSYWSSLRSGNPRMSPGKAIGLLFVPIFNIYWIFQVYGGFATDYNRYIKDKGIDARNLSQGLLVCNVLLMILPIPLLNWIIQSMAIARICDAVNVVRKQTSATRP